MSGAEAMVEDSLMWRNYATYIGISVLILVSFISVATWDIYAYRGTSLYVKGALGWQTLGEKSELADICFELKKYDCVEKLYVELAASGGTTELAQLGHLLVRRQKYQKAAATYRQLIVLDSQNIEARFQFAKALGELGQIDEASKQFEYVLRSKPGVLQVTVAQKYVNYLIKAHRVEQARRLIQRLNLPISISQKDKIPPYKS